MSDLKEVQLGNCVVARFLDLEKDKKNPEYTNIVYRDSDNVRYGARTFSIKTGSDLHTQLENIAVDSVIIIWTNSPKIADSKAGKKYLQWFPTSIEVVS